LLCVLIFKHVFLFLFYFFINFLIKKI
jgi:hypothetical protein